MMAAVYLLPCLVLTSAHNYYWYDKPQVLEDRPTMVHLFEWKWTDIAAECENFLQHYGYGAVQISPPNEHIVFVENDDVPWYVRYQPVSYKLISRSGDESEFKDMVNRCNKVGVRIIVDVVMNHMAAVSQKSGINGRKGSGGSFFDATDGIELFPEVPYTNVDFNDWRCPKKNIEGSDYQYNAEAVRNCRLVGLLDLDQGRPEVREKLIAFLNHLIDLGIAGFRCDASKHMWPGDLMLILNGTRNLREDIFGPNQRPFIVHEVIDRGHEAIKVAEYTGLGRYTNFNFGGAVSAAAKGTTGWDLLSSLGPGYGYGNGADNDVLNFIDNHDNQRDDHPYVVTYKDGDRYRLAVAYMMAWPYGYPRVMSSFYFDHRDQGPPHSGSKTGYATRSPTFVSHDETCNVTSGWVCEHRWPTIREMAKFRSTVKGAAATQIVKDNNRLAFARRGRGFFAINGNNGKWGRFFATTMPEGNYCDQYAGSLKNGKCTGRTIHVKKNGQAFLRIGGKQAVAFSLASRIGDPPVRPDLEDYSKTVILIKKNTHGGQYVFIRGGTSHANDDECQPGLYQQRNDKCAVPIMHNTTVPFVYNEYLSWSQGDEFLDFEGPEEEQGTYNGQAASGTPLAYSTNNPSEFEYNQHNKYGPSYWLVELFVDCSKTDQGWFELKGYLTPSHEWEPNINQGKCTGSIGGSAPFRSINHIAKCGAVNVFKWGSNECIVDPVCF